MSENMDLVPLFGSTIERFKQKERDGNIYAAVALFLYIEYARMACRKGNRVIQATESYIRNPEKGMGLSERKYKGAKQLLREMGLISGSKTKYIKGRKTSFMTVFVDRMALEFNEFLSKKTTEAEVSKCHLSRGIKMSPQVTDPIIKQYTDPIIKEKESKDSLCSASKRRNFFVSKSGRVFPGKEVNPVRSPAPTPDPNPNVNPVQKAPAIRKSNSKHNSCSKSSSASASDNDSQQDIPPMSANPFEGKKVPKPRYTYTTLDEQMYMALISLGFLAHRKDTKAYYKSMDMIHEILHPSEFRPPYSCSKGVPDDYKLMNWTYDLFLEVASHHVKKSDFTKNKSISSFILAETYKTNKSWSPLVNAHIELVKASANSLDGDAKKFYRWLDEENMLEDLEPRDIKNILINKDLHMMGYRMSQNSQTTYYDSSEFLLFSYMKERMKKPSFMMVFARSENFFKEFIRDMTKQGTLIKEGFH
jgi:hypothetical protein